MESLLHFLFLLPHLYIKKECNTNLVTPCPTVSFPPSELYCNLLFLFAEWAPAGPTIRTGRSSKNNVHTHNKTKTRASKTITGQGWKDRRANVQQAKAKQEAFRWFYRAPSKIKSIRSRQGHFQLSPALGRYVCFLIPVKVHPRGLKNANRKDRKCKGKNMQKQICKLQGIRWS